MPYANDDSDERKLERGDITKPPQDYRGAGYHSKRHPELIADGRLREAWSWFSLVAYFSHVKPGDKVLEFGSGLGNNLVELARRTRVWGVEPSALGREISCADGINTVASLRELGDDKFDTILCRHVLEHVEHPKFVLEDLRSRLSVEGILIVVVPMELPSKMPKANDMNQHLYCWNARTLCNLMARSGLRARSVRHVGYAGRRKLLFLRKWWSGRAYAKAVRILGHLTGSLEIVVECQRAVD